MNPKHLPPPGSALRIVLIYAFVSAVWIVVSDRLLQLDSDLRLALERQQFGLYYQPIMQLQSLQLLGFEALLRWRHPARGTVSPNEFIPAAEQTGLILPIGEWALQQACYQCQHWQEQWQGDSLLTMSVNMSARQLQQPNLLTQIESILKRTGLQPQQLKLEITESLLVESAPQITRRFERLRELGIQLIIDDFRHRLFLPQLSASIYF